MILRPPKAVLKPEAGPQMLSQHRAPLGHLPEGSPMKKEKSEGNAIALI